MSQVPRLTLPGILIQMSIIPSDSGMVVIITQLKILSVMRCSPMAWFKWFIGEISNQGGILKMQKYSRVVTSGQGLRWKKVSRGPKFLTQCYCSSVTFSAFVHLRPHAWHHRLNSIFWNTITIKWWIFFCEDQILNFEWILNWVLQQNKSYSKQISLWWWVKKHCILGNFWMVSTWLPHCRHFPHMLTAFSRHQRAFSDNSRFTRFRYFLQFCSTIIANFITIGCQGH